jgi:hypothetical protein
VFFPFPETPADVGSRAFAAESEVKNGMQVMATWRQLGWELAGRLSFSNGNPPPALLRRKKQQSQRESAANGRHAVVATACGLVGVRVPNRDWGAAFA